MRLINIKFKKYAIIDSSYFQKVKFNFWLKNKDNFQIWFFKIYTNNVKLVEKLVTVRDKNKKNLNYITTHIEAKTTTYSSWSLLRNGWITWSDVCLNN